MRVSKYLSSMSTFRKTSAAFSAMRELCIQVRTERFQEARGASVRQKTLLKQVYSRLRMYYLYKKSKHMKACKAMQLRYANLSQKCFSIIKFYSQHHMLKRLVEGEALRQRENQMKAGSLLQVFKVGLYWAGIKGRFRSSSSLATSSSYAQSSAERRIYLAMKYGNRWRSKVQIRKQQRAGLSGQGQTSQNLQTNEEMPEHQDKKIRQLLGLYDKNTL